ncbi:Pyridoxal-phosphate-dependent serine hydroxymethyltransferase [Gossypium australe]|uniref:Pyridoxal-phosphate-dependent serine hydroxymethyltransferase n=1 Tax=Gossypium australe TaxID=47621 RepID=A0A5B6WEM9_9ROSI|nr:Pyridoxal-phosphate-dependent serine hydroxymethyltransferase [Gossypium australe]
MNLVQGERSVVEYEAEFLRLSKYARALVATEYDKCVRFEDGLRYDLRCRKSSALSVKGKIRREIRARSDRPSRNEASVASNMILGCTDCERRHLDEC